MSKYELLWNYTKENNRENYKLTYKEIRDILGFELDHSFLPFKRLWVLSRYNINKSKDSNI